MPPQDNAADPLAQLDPLQVSPPPVAAGYGNPLLAIGSEFFKLHAADQRTQANRELSRREQLAQQFEDFSKDPRYANHPDVQRTAHMHAVAIRQLPYTKKLPSQYEFDDKAGGVPAYNALTHRVVQKETARRGEPPQPAEPPPPPPPPAPYSSAGLGLDEESQGPAADQFPGAPPAPGGEHIGPNQISPAPAVGAPSAPASPASPQYEDLLPMTPPEMAAFQNSIPVSALPPEMAQALGYDPDANPDALVDLRSLKSSQLLTRAADRNARLGIHGLMEDEQGNIVRVPDDRLSPEQLYKRSAADLAEARMGLVQAQAISEPIKRRAQLEHWQAQESIARQGLQIAQGKLGVSAGRLDFERSLYGMGGPLAGTSPQSPLGSAGGSGGPADFSSSNDAGIRQTSRGNYWADSRQYFGKGKEILNGLRKQGLVILDKDDASRMDQIDSVRKDQEAILNSILSRLPKDASGRVGKGITNKLAQFFQTNDELASYGSWRQTAISSLKALVSGGGFRMNQSEIFLSIANDIPKITDTASVAQRKIDHIRAQFDNLEDSMLIPRHGQPGGGPQPTSTSAPASVSTSPGPPPGPQRLSKQQTNRKTGETRTVYSDDNGASWHP